MIRVRDRSNLFMWSPQGNSLNANGTAVGRQPIPRCTQFSKATQGFHDSCRYPDYTKDGPESSRTTTRSGRTMVSGLSIRKAVSRTNRPVEHLAESLKLVQQKVQD